MYSNEITLDMLGTDGEEKLHSMDKEYSKSLKLKSNVAELQDLYGHTKDDECHVNHLLDGTVHTLSQTGSKCMSNNLLLQLFKYFLYHD